MLFSVVVMSPVNDILKKTGSQKSCDTVPIFEINSPFWVLGMNFGIFTDTLVFQHGTVETVVLLSLSASRF
jgi:hypothetical protein